VLDFNPCSVTFPIWSATHADNIGKYDQTFHAAQSIGKPSSARFRKGAKMNLNMSCSVSAFTCFHYCSTLVDFERLGGTANSASSRTAIDQGLSCQADGRFPRVI